MRRLGKGGKGWFASLMERRRRADTVFVLVGGIWGLRRISISERPRCLEKQKLALL